MVGTPRIGCPTSKKNVTLLQTSNGVFLHRSINFANQNAVFILESFAKFVPNGFKFLTITTIFLQSVHYTQ
jgi:hypothetical protein